MEKVYKYCLFSLDKQKMTVKIKTFVRRLGKNPSIILGELDRCANNVAEDHEVRIITDNFFYDVRAYDKKADEKKRIPYITRTIMYEEGEGYFEPLDEVVGKLQNLQEVQGILCKMRSAGRVRNLGGICELSLSEVNRFAGSKEGLEILEMFLKKNGLKPGWYL